MAKAARYTSVLAALLTFGVFLFVAVSQNDGVFEYPLDDVYIHLAMAEQMAAGGYGVNAGEYASAASSPIYPIFLTPFAGTEVQRWLPLGWNVLALALAAWLMATCLIEAGFGRWAVVLGALAPACLSMHIAAYSGMENMAHGAASLAIVLGLFRFVQTNRIGLLLLIGIILAPAFRLEGLALSMAAGGAVLFLGRPFAGLALILLSVATFAAFALFLQSLGLPSLPHSVEAKLPDPSNVATGFLAGISENLAKNVSQYGGRYLAALLAVLWLVALSVVRQDRARGIAGLAVVAAVAAHLAFASVGWLDRYENYAILATVAALALLLSGASSVLKVGLVSLTFVGGALTYGPYTDNNMMNMRAIHVQQAQMSRFVKEHLKEPAAVNDLGYVTWANPNYILDLYGLASAEALQLRLMDPPKGWGDRLADERDVRFAMIYDDWVGDALGPGWVRLGSFWTNAPGAFLGGFEVAFYARDKSDVARLTPLLETWRAELPKNSKFVFVGEDGRS